MILDRRKGIVEPFSGRSLTVTVVASVAELLTKLPGRSFRPSEAISGSEYCTNQRRRRRSEVNDIDIVGPEGEGKIDTKRESRTSLVGFGFLEGHCHVDIASLAGLVASP